MTIETPEQACRRLLRIIAKARFLVREEPYVVTPMPPGIPPTSDTMACVRDGALWS
jgi:hypothetical protein